MFNIGLRRKWKRIDDHLRKALLELENTNGPIEAAEMLDFLDHNEFGLACDQLEWICKDQDLTISALAENEINDAKRLMGYFATATEG